MIQSIYYQRRRAARRLLESKGLWIMDVQYVEREVVPTERPAWTCADDVLGQTAIRVRKLLECSSFRRITPDYSASGRAEERGSPRWRGDAAFEDMRMP